MAMEIGSEVHSILLKLGESGQNYSLIVMALIANVCAKQLFCNIPVQKEPRQAPLLTTKFNHFLQQRSKISYPTKQILPPHPAPTVGIKPKF
jgi:hypothetical protein